MRQQPHEALAHPRNEATGPIEFDPIRHGVIVFRERDFIEARSITAKLVPWPLYSGICDLTRISHIYAGK